MKSSCCGICRVDHVLHPCENNNSAINSNLLPCNVERGERIKGPSFLNCTLNWTMQTNQNILVLKINIIFIHVVFVVLKLVCFFSEKCKACVAPI